MDASKNLSVYIPRPFIISNQHLPQPYFLYVGRYELPLYNFWSTYGQNPASLVVLLFHFYTSGQKKAPTNGPDDPFPTLYVLYPGIS